MWVRIFTAIFALSCCLWFAHADSECPDVRCRDSSWCTGNKDYFLGNTYSYLEDGTKCPRCKECFLDIPPFPGSKCPVVSCPLVAFPPGCHPIFTKYFMDYKGTECPACSDFVCEDDSA